MSLLCAIGVVTMALGQAGADGGVLSRLDRSHHNFFGPAGSPSPEVDLCQLCHVPNRVGRAASGRPLWSRQEPGRLSALDRVADPLGPPLALRWSGSTLRCLSCHDGTVSGINIVFRPSSSSLRDDLVASDRAREGKAKDPSVMWTDEWMAMATANHPVSVPYPLNGPTEFRTFSSRAVPLDPSQWVPDPRRLGLKLLSDTSGFDLLAGTAGVECVSCHDPHGTPNSFFLRMPKERSQLCLACHRK